MNRDPFDNRSVIDPESFGGTDFPPIVTPEEEALIENFYAKNPDLKQHAFEEIRPDLAKAHIFSKPTTPDPFHEDEPWIQTYSGRRFNPTNPHVDAIVIQDIAHSLSMQCRFSGHCKKFYCVTPDTKILTSNLTWVPAGDLKLFDGLVGFDEYPIKNFDNNRNRRKMKYSNVLHTGIIEKHVFALHLSDGTVLKSTDEHPWLISSKKSRNQKWETTSEIVRAVSDGKQRFMLKFLEPWNNHKNYELEYLSGIVDGEGTINCNRQGFMVSIAQKPGPVLNKIKGILDAFNFKYGEYPQESGVHNLQILGSWHEKLKFLSMTNSVRLLDKYKIHLRDESWRKEFDSMMMLTIDKIEDLGIQKVVALETSSKTYFAEGFGSHNSVAQHSVLVSHICNHDDALWGLMHDASEAYLVDIPRPLKRSGKFQAYRDFEEVMTKAICKRFGLPVKEPPSVKRADTILLATEARDLMSPLRSDWVQPVEPLPFRIDAWSPQEAKNNFMKRFFNLIGADSYHYEHYLEHESKA